LCGKGEGILSKGSENHCFREKEENCFVSPFSLKGRGRSERKKYPIHHRNYLMIWKKEKGENISFTESGEGERGEQTSTRSRGDSVL